MRSSWDNSMSLSLRAWIAALWSALVGTFAARVRGRRPGGWVLVSVERYRSEHVSFLCLQRVNQSKMS